MSQITPHLLWVGHADDGRNFRQILDVGIQAIVQLAVEEPSLQPPREIIYCRFPLVDAEGNKPELLDLSVRSVAGFLRRRIPTLVCSEAGVSRAPAIAAAALSLFLEQRPEVCLETVVQQHPSDVLPGLWFDLASMYERLTDRSRRVMQLAREEARRRQREHLRTTDILVALVREKEGVGACAIDILGLDLARISEAIDKDSQQVPSEDQLTQPAGIPLARKVIDYAFEECKNLRHNYVGTEHLLLGIARVHEGRAARVLANLGVNPDDIRNVVFHILGHPSRR